MNRLTLLLPLMASFVSAQTRSPDEIYRDLHTKFPNREATLRWANLDADAELEAIIIDDRQEEEGSHFASIYDRYLGKWTKAGEFRCHRGCPLNSFVGVYQLTEDSPNLIFINRELGGSSGYNLALEGFLLRGGKLIPTMALTQRAETIYEFLLYAAIDAVYAHGKALVVYSRRYWHEDKAWKQTCTVMTWSSARSSFVNAPNQQAEYCDLQSGEPIKHRSWLSALPASPLY
jgi:hypothetical protein